MLFYNWVVYFNDDVIGLECFLKEKRILRYGEIVRTKIIKKYTDVERCLVLYINEYKVGIWKLYGDFKSKLEEKNI